MSKRKYSKMQRSLPVIESMLEAGKSHRQIKKSQDWKVTDQYTTY